MLCVSFAFFAIWFTFDEIILIPFSSGAMSLGLKKQSVGTAHRHISYVGGCGSAALLSLALYFFVFSLVERDLLLFYFLVLSCDSYRSFRFDLIELTARFEG